MKRLLVAIFLCIFLVTSTSYAVVQLAPIAAAAIGASLLTILGTTNTKVALNPQGSFGYTGPDLTVPVAVYNQYMQAGAQIALGYLTNIPFDVKKAYEQGLFLAEPEISIVINNTFPISVGPPAVNDIVDQNSFGSTPAPCNKSIKVISVNIGPYSYRTPPSPPACIANGFTYWEAKSCCDSLGREFGRWITITGTTVTDSRNWPLTGPPPSLTDAQSNELSKKLAQLAAQNQSLKDELEKVVKNNPGLLGQPSQITPQQIQQYAQQIAQSAIDSNISAIQSALANDPSNVALQLQLSAAQSAAQQAAAQQLAEQAAQEAAKETFSPISDNPFTEPYNPGEYDIPARFATFLNRVKSTGLFSFSADFFNSLPGGGSPIYEIEAGQYGHHTIDLSQTLTVGLAVLKTILLACFGFLSIRAVIMKR